MGTLLGVHRGARVRVYMRGKCCSLRVLSPSHGRATILSFRFAAPLSVNENRYSPCCARPAPCPWPGLRSCGVVSCDRSPESCVSSYSSELCAYER